MISKKKIDTKGNIEKDPRETVAITKWINEWINKPGMEKIMVQIRKRQRCTTYVFKKKEKDFPKEPY